MLIALDLFSPIDESSTQKPKFNKFSAGNRCLRQVEISDEHPRTISEFIQQQPVYQEPIVYQQPTIHLEPIIHQPATIHPQIFYPDEFVRQPFYQQTDRINYSPTDRIQQNEQTPMFKSTFYNTTKDDTQTKDELFSSAYKCDVCDRSTGKNGLCFIKI